MFQRITDPDVVSWTIMIDSYNQLGLYKEALMWFEDMRQNGVNADKAVFISILQTCSGGLLSLQHVKEIHNLIIASGLELDGIVGNVLINMYAKRGEFDDAQSVLNRLPKREISAFNAFIRGYTQHGYYQEALVFFEKLQQEESVEPNLTTFVCILKACANMVALSKGNQIYAKILEKGFELDSFSGSALVDLYMSCGHMERACIVFNSLPNHHHVAPWNSLLAGYARHNEYLLGIQCFEAFKTMGLKPNDVTYLCLLSVCSHAGLVEQGCLVFKSMREEIYHSRKHFLLEYHNSMVGLLGHHPEYLKEAEDLLETLPFPANVVGWTSLLTACRNSTDLMRGTYAAKSSVELDTSDEVTYITLSNIYATCGVTGQTLKKSA